MNFLGIEINPNLMGVLLGLGMILFGLGVSYVYQKIVAKTYRGRVDNTMVKDKQK